MGNPPLRFIQLTDPHISVGAKRIQFGVDTIEAFRRVLRAIEPITSSSDFLILTGDLVSDGQPESYEVLRDLLKPVAIPVYFLMGNHDDRAVFRRVILGHAGASHDPFRYRFQLNGTQFIALDSFLEGTAAGSLDEDQLRWLQACLQEKRETILFIHHHIIPVGLTWLDRLILLNRQEVVRLLEKHPAVRALIFGHIHRQFDTLLGTVTLIGTPSTCYQFALRSDAREISQEHPAYRTITLADDQIMSEVCWVKQKDSNVHKVRT